MQAICFHPHRISHSHLPCLFFFVPPEWSEQCIGRYRMAFAHTPKPQYACCLAFLISPVSWGQGPTTFPRFSNATTLCFLEHSRQLRLLRLSAWTSVFFDSCGLPNSWWRAIDYVWSWSCWQPQDRIIGTIGCWICCLFLVFAFFLM